MLHRHLASTAARLKPLGYGSDTVSVWLALRGDVRPYGNPTAVVIKHTSEERCTYAARQMHAEITTAARLRRAFPGGHPLLAPLLETVSRPGAGTTSFSIYGGVSLADVMDAGAMLPSSPSSLVEVGLDLAACLLSATAILHKEVRAPAGHCVLGGARQGAGRH